MAGYLIHMWVSDAVAPFGPKDSPFWWALFVFGVFFLFTYVFVRYLNRHRMFPRL